MTIHTGGYMDAHRGLDGRMLWSYRMLYIQHCNNVFVLAQTFTYYKTCTSSWVDNCVYVVDGSISVDVGMGGAVGRETEAAQQTALVLQLCPPGSQAGSMISWHIIMVYKGGWAWRNSYPVKMYTVYSGNTVHVQMYMYSMYVQIIKYYLHVHVHGR